MAAESHAISVVPPAFFLTLSCNADRSLFPAARTPVDCALRPPWSESRERHLQMGGDCHSALGFALMYVEYRFATKKKEGFTNIDRQRILGIFWLTLFFAALVGGVMWISD